MAMIAFIGALALAVAAARNYSLPNLLGFSGDDVMHQADFWCSLSSGVLAIGASLAARAALRERRATAAERIYSGFAILGLTALLFAVWLPHVLYYALWLAPTHAVAVTLLVVCFQRQREESSRRIADDREFRNQ